MENNNKATDDNAVLQDDENKPSESTTKKTVIQAVKFTLFSAGAGVIQFVTATLLDILFQKVFVKENVIAFFTSIFKSFEPIAWSYYVSYLIGLILSVIFNFTVNRKFTFKSANNIPIAMLKVLGYYAVFTPFSLWFDSYPVEHWGWNHTVILIVTMLINFVTEFVFDKFVVFREKKKK